MTAPTTTVQIPQPLYQRVERMAHLSRHSVEEVVAQAIEANVPSLPENLPDDMRDQLAALEDLSDDELWRVARSTVSLDKQALHSELLEKNREGTLTVDERATLTQLRFAADQLMLRKAYAYALLKWRGHRLPTLTELAAQA